MQTELNTPTYSDLIVAYAHGKTLQFQDTELAMVGEAKNWNDLTADNIGVLPSLMRTDGKQSQRFNFRIKPRTVKIGDREVEAPVLTPSVGQELWFVNTMRGCELESFYANDHVHVRARIAAGLCFTSGAAAVAAHEAMTTLLRGPF